MNEWETWGDCFRNCDQGMQNRKRTIKTNPICKGQSCPLLSVSLYCHATAHGTTVISIAMHTSHETAVSFPMHIAHETVVIFIVKHMRQLSIDCYAHCT